MVKRNPHFANLKGSYLFPEINKRKQEFLKKNPGVKLISLGIGDTTLPLPTCITDAMAQFVNALSTKQGYSGYGPEQGNYSLRTKIADKLYKNIISPDEVFISDGAKCDIGRLQLLFGSNATIAVQDPTYPVYVDTSVAIGQSGHHSHSSQKYGGIIYMPCVPENDFFPDLQTFPKTDLIYFCSPNNPTGSVANKAQLQELVTFAKKNRSIIIFDAAYSSYIEDPSLPKSIYEIEGADEVAIELGSFSKMAGFTGVRLGWSIVPKKLLFEDGKPVLQDWHRMSTTFFNGASNIAQAGGEAILTEQGLEWVREMVHAYMQNAQIIYKGLSQIGLPVFGGKNAPYIWTKFPGKTSWEIFEIILEKAHVVTTPGSGFGIGGEGFVRFSAFNQKDQVELAVELLVSVSKELEICCHFS